MWVERIKYILHNISSTAHTAVTQGLQETYLLSPDILNLELLFIDDTSNTEVPVYKQLEILEFLSHDYAFSNRLRHINATIPQSAYDDLKTHNSDSHKMKNDRKMFAKQYYQYLCDIFSDAKNLQSFSWIVSGPSYDRVMDSVSKNITDLTIGLMDNEDVVDGIFQRSAYINKVKKLLKFKNLKSLNFIYSH